MKHGRQMGTGKGSHLNDGAYLVLDLPRLKTNILRFWPLAGRV